MAHSIDHLIEETPRGCKIELKRLYMYPDGHANLEFADGTHWPAEDELELMILLTRGLLRPLQRRARHPEREPART